VYVAPHWLIYRDGRDVPLLAQQLDMSSLTLVGEPVRLLDAIVSPGGYAIYSLTANGVLLAWQRPEGDEGVVFWADRHGGVDPVEGGGGGGWTYAVSASGKRLASGGFGVWVNDLTRSVVTPLASGTSPVRRTMLHPAWSPGDTLLAYAVGAGGFSLQLYSFRDAKSETLFDSGTQGVSGVDWMPDGSGIVFVRSASDSVAASELWIYSMASRTARALFGATEIASPRVSPDGRWIAYVSDEPGLRQVYVRPLPGPGAPQRVSANGGSQPYWRSSDGRALFYTTPNDRIMEVEFSAGPPGAQAVLGAPRPVLGVAEQGNGLWGVSPDGQRFLRVQPRDSDGLTLVNDWRSKLPRTARR
jgi:serine/threonine-protein kinase